MQRDSYGLPLPGEPTDAYWADIDERMAEGAHQDREAARAMNETRRDAPGR